MVPVFVTITSRGEPADDLGYLLGKHPQRVNRFDVGLGQATVFFPHADAQVCTCALLVDVDADALTRSHRFRGEGFELGDHINDRAYAASSLLAVALKRVFGSALAGTCRERPGMVGQALPLTIRVPALPAKDGPGFVRELFEPLGWRVDARPVPLVADDPAWGDSRYVDLVLTGDQTVQAALQHLYVLLPVLDDAKHYWVGEAETDKLLRNAGDWLGSHPLREQIMARYLAHQNAYVVDATQRLLSADGDVDELPEHSCQPSSLAVQRRAALVEQLVAHRAWRVADVGCGEGKLTLELLNDARFTHVLGTDVSPTVLERAEKALGRLSDRQRERAEFVQGSITYRDDRLCGFDALVLAEVVEHIDPDRLAAIEANIWAAAGAGLVLVTTPNADYNPVYGMAAGQLRHDDHRFEWTRAQFAQWAHGVASRYGYGVKFVPVGPVDDAAGPPTQMAVFTREGAPE